MWKVCAALLPVMMTALVLGVVAYADDRGSPQPCQYGAPLSQGTTTISFDNATATAVVSGWSFCGESTQVAYSWSTGATTRSISVSPGQCVSVTASIGTNSNGLAWSQTASGCAQTGGGGGGGTTCDAPNVTGRD